MLLGTAAVSIKTDFNDLLLFLRKGSIDRGHGPLEYRLEHPVNCFEETMEEDRSMEQKTEAPSMGSERDYEKGMARNPH
jgi:hypothetical protein